MTMLPIETGSPWNYQNSQANFVELRGELTTSQGNVESLQALTAIAESKVKFTSVGGLAILLVNKTGAATVKGHLVTPSSTDNQVILVPVNAPSPIGVFLDSGIADGQPAWVVVSGIAEVYFIGDATAGHLARTGLTADTGEVAGQAISETIPTSPFATDKHFCEIGHVIQSRTGPGLAKCVLHFN